MEKEFNISQEEFEQIENYLFGQMDANERNLFEQKLAENAQSKLQLDEIRLMTVGIKEATLANKVNSFHQKIVPQKPTVGKSIFMRFSSLLAAAIIILISIGAWLFFFKSSTEEKLFAEYYKPDTGLLTAMGVSDNYTFDKAMIDYKTGNYDSSVKAWEALLVEHPNNDTLYYFLGSVYLAKQNNEKAITYFKKVIDVGPGYFLKDAYWYAGLILLKDGKNEDAIHLLKLSERPQASELLLKLDNK